MALREQAERAELVPRPVAVRPGDGGAFAVAHVLGLLRRPGRCRPAPRLLRQVLLDAGVGPAMRGAREERAEQPARWSATDRAQKVICVFRVAQLAQLQPGAVGKGEPEGSEPAWLARVTLDAGVVESELRDHLKVVGFGR